MHLLQPPCQLKPRLLIIYLHSSKKLLYEDKLLVFAQHHLHQFTCFGTHGWISKEQGQMKTYSEFSHPEVAYNLLISENTMIFRRKIWTF